MPPRKPSATRSPQTEQHLTDRGFTWEFRTGVDLDQFDEAASLHNQARVGKPIDTDTVSRYVAALGNGDTFPGIVAAETRLNRPLLIADGNHRFQAHKQSGAKTIDAYVIVGAAPQAITMLTFEANTRHGLPTNETDRVHQGLYLMDNGISGEEAARRLGLRAATLRIAAQRAAGDRRADSMGIARTQWDRLLISIQTRLGQIGTDEGFAAMTRLAIDANLSTGDVGKAVTGMQSLRSSTKQVEYVTALRQTFAEALQQRGGASRGARVRTPRTVYGMTLGQLSALPTPNEIVDRMTEEDRPVWLKKTTDGINRLTAIRRALEQR